MIIGREVMLVKDWRNPDSEGMKSGLDRDLPI